MVDDYVLLVSGSRNLAPVDYLHMRHYLNAVIERRGKPRRIMHGGAHGADSLASRFAYENKIDLDIRGALWGTHGNSAGLIRNRVMADALFDGDTVIAFPSGESRGTRHMITLATQRRDVDLIVVQDDGIVLDS